MNATYGWKPSAPTTHTISIDIATALAAYFMCERHELDDNCELDHRDLGALRIIRAMVRIDDIPDVDEIIRGIHTHKCITLTVDP